MTPIPLTPLEAWVGRKVGRTADQALQRQDLTRYQLTALNRTLAHARQNSPFYRKRLAGLTLPLTSLDQIAGVPCTTSDDLRRDPLAQLCVSQDRIARVVTLETSGTTGPPKRLFFTDADLELTVDFFHHGMATLVTPGQRVLILMPGRLPGSVGDLLVKALARMHVAGIVHGPVSDPETAIRVALQEGIDSLVGIPVQVLAMARHDHGPRLAGHIGSVLLSTDFVSDAVVAAIECVWGCRVFKHYGMTEMGLGGGVECAARNGYHFREADLLVEIVDPRTGRPAPDGTAGEIVFTTLTREGMPLIRYCTGDRAGFKLAPCPCGTVLRTLDTVQGRWHDRVVMGKSPPLLIGHLDEALFGLGGILDYQAEMRSANDADRLTLRVAAREMEDFHTLEERIRRTVSALPAVRTARLDRRLEIVVQPVEGMVTASKGTAKRRINDLRKRKSHP